MIAKLQGFKSPKQQLGATFLTIGLVVVMIGIFLLSALKVAPAYVDNNIIENAVNNLEAREGLETMSIGEIRSAIMRTLDTNNIRNFDANNIQQIRIDGIDYIDINYESRIPLFYNIEAVVIFENRFRK